MRQPRALRAGQKRNNIFIYFFFLTRMYRTRRLLRIHIMYCILDFRRSSSLSSFFFSSSFGFFFRPRSIAASLPESERDNDRFAFVGLITYRWKRVCQPRTADGGGGGGWPDERGSERERATERKNAETCVYNNNNLLRCLNDFQLLLPRTVRANKSWSIKLYIIMHARARAPAADLFDRRRTRLSCLRAQHGLRNGYDTWSYNIPPV